MERRLQPAHENKDGHEHVKEGEATNKPFTLPEMHRLKEGTGWS